MNYLEIGNLIILPKFGIKEDEEAIKQFQKILPKKTIATIDSNKIAKKGGILNCISWNIQK